MRGLSFVGPVIVLAVVLPAGGCGSDGPPVYGVSGIVTIGGSPAQNIQVTFMPTDASHPIASGKVDASGRYTLTSGAKNRAGAVAGSYKVVLTQLDVASQAELDARYSASGRADPIPVASFPKEYQSVDTTPAEVDVAAKANTIDINIP